WHRVRSSNVLLVASMFPTWVSCCTFLLRLGGLWLLPSLPTRRSSDLHKLLYPFVCIGPFDGSADEFPYPVDQNPSDRKKDQRKEDRKSTRLNSSHVSISYAVFCLKKKIITWIRMTFSGLTSSQPAELA